MYPEMKKVSHLKKFEMFFVDHGRRDLKYALSEKVFYRGMLNFVKKIQRINRALKFSNKNRAFQVNLTNE